MIDYMFYRQLGPQNIKHMYDGSLGKEGVLAMVEANRSDLVHIDQIETTNDCNLQCVMCPRGKNNLMTRPVQPMDEGLFRTAIDQIDEGEQEKARRGIGKEDFLRDPPPDLIWPRSAYDVSALRLHHFGSPMLDPHMLDRVQYIKEETTLAIQFSETIINLKRHEVRRLFALGLDRLIIALDGTNTEEFEATRGIHVPNFEKMIDRVCTIVDDKIAMGDRTQLDVQIIKMQHAPEEKFLSEWDAVPGVNVHIKPFFPYPDVPHDLGTGGDTVFNRSCRIPFTSLTVMTDGSVVPCNSDYNGEQIFGNIGEQSLQEIWESPQVKAFCRKFIFDLFEKGELCNRCGFYPHYKGSHPSDSSLHILQ